MRPDADALALPLEGEIRRGRVADNLLSGVFCKLGAEVDGLEAKSTVDVEYREKPLGGWKLSLALCEVGRGSTEREPVEEAFEDVLGDDEA